MTSSLSPMLRRLFNVLAALSLLPCASTLGMWLWTGNHGLGVLSWARWTPGGADVGTVTTLETVGGVLVLRHQRVLVADPRHLQTLRHVYPEGFRSQSRSFATIIVPPRQLRRDAVNQGAWQTTDGWLASAPRHDVLVATAVLPLSALALHLTARRRRRTRYPPGYCRQCGYDLRGSPERCPECGETPSTDLV